MRKSLHASINNNNKERFINPFQRNFKSRQIDRHKHERCEWYRVLYNVFLIKAYFKTLLGKGALKRASP